MRRSRTGLNWIGVVLPVGKLTARADARPRRPSRSDLGDGDIRLTVWQNLLISGVPDDKVEARRSRHRDARARHQATSIRAGLVACTGNVGCRFAASDTKRHAEDIARMVRGARRARHAGQHPSHRLPSFLRAALHRRHRPARLQGRGLRGRRHGRGLSHPGRRRLRAGRGAGARALPRRQGRGRAARPSSACSRPTWPTAPRRDETFQAFTRRHDDRRTERNVRGAGRMNQPMRPPSPASCPRTRRSRPSSAPG